MKKEKISNNVIRRMPMYLRKLDDLLSHGIDRISSNELGSLMGLTPSQIRQDFSCFGEFGQQGYGYRVAELRDQVARILGMNRGYSVIIVGVGNLGHALMENMRFDEIGFRLAAAFDASPEKIGSVVSGITIMDSHGIGAWLKENSADIAVLTVPKSVAREMAVSIYESGVKAIWNFTNTDLDLDSDIQVENIHFSDSLLTLSYYITIPGSDK
ncbi:MAG: redox-sensing transcriptional repressor Rex [Clostridia bacterium]|nr:redox-sensing transcriptional repressor Rex [Clostridia bacterium]